MANRTTKNERESLEFIETNCSQGTYLFTDGASDHNTAGVGICIVNNGEIIDYIAESIPGASTNNEAEYTAMLRALEYVKENSLENVTIYSDSKLIVYQLNGEWVIQKEHLVPLYLDCRELIEELNVTLEHVHREKNYFADFYSKYPARVTESQIKKFRDRYYLK